MNDNNRAGREGKFSPWSEPPLAREPSPARHGGEGGHGSHTELWFTLSAFGFVIGGILAGVLLIGGLTIVYLGFQGLR